MQLLLYYIYYYFYIHLVLTFESKKLFIYLNFLGCKNKINLLHMQNNFFYSGALSDRVNLD